MKKQNLSIPAATRTQSFMMPAPACPWALRSETKLWLGAPGLLRLTLLYLFTLWRLAYVVQLEPLVSV